LSHNTNLSNSLFLFLADAQLDNPNNNVRHSSSNSTITTTTPSSIRLVTPTGKSSPPTNLQFQITDKSSSSTTNGTFSTPKTYIFNPQQSSTTTVNKQSSSSSLLTLIPPGTTSPKIQTLNSVTISSTNDMSTGTDKSSANPNQSVFLSKNRVTLVQPLITNSTSSSNNGKQSTTNTVTPKLVIQQNANSSTTNTNFWQQQQQTQATKICKFIKSFLANKDGIFFYSFTSIINHSTDRYEQTNVSRNQWMRF
jgi:hypothetical protein